MESAVAYTDDPDGSAAGRALADRILSGLGGLEPDAVIVFAAPSYDAERLLAALEHRCRPGVMVGASSAGEFTRQTSGEGMACAIGLRSSEMQFAAGIGHSLSRDPAAAARRIAGGFRGTTDRRHTYRSALVMTDALAGHADQLVEELTLATAGRYQFFGGGAGDNAQFRRTQVFVGRQALTDAAVALEILSAKPLGIGVSHGWVAVGDGFRVTEASGMRLVSLNGFPALDAFLEHAEKTGQRIDRSAPIPFFLQNILGIDTGAGHRLRVPLAIHDDGSVTCASEIPVGSIVYIMGSTERSAVLAAEQATAAALAALGAHRPKTALFFDCVATRLRLGEAFEDEIAAVGGRLGNIDFAGCNTHGQIARAEGQFGGFHNCTAVVCIFPE
jgi:hypothetical protein